VRPRNCAAVHAHIRGSIRVRRQSALLAHGLRRSAGSIVDGSLVRCDPVAFVGARDRSETDRADYRAMLAARGNTGGIQGPGRLRRRAPPLPSPAGKSVQVEHHSIVAFESALDLSELPVGMSRATSYSSLREQFEIAACDCDREAIITC
jgi:hypothetical protein